MILKFKKQLKNANVSMKVTGSLEDIKAKLSSSYVELKDIAASKDSITAALLKNGFTAINWRL